MEVAVAAITRPMDTDSIDVRGHCVELLMEIAHNCGVACLLPRLPALLQHLYGVVTEVNDLEYNSYIFPFISTVVREGLAAGAPVFATLEPQLQPFIPYFDSLLYSPYGSVHAFSSCIEYRDVNLPTAASEFGRLGGPFNVDADDSSYHFVRVDTRRVECKAAALDAAMSIKESMLALRHAFAPAELDKLAALLTELCQHTDSVIRHHAVGERV